MRCCWRPEALGAQGPCAASGGGSVMGLALNGPVDSHRTQMLPLSSGGAKEEHPGSYRPASLCWVVGRCWSKPSGKPEDSQEDVKVIDNSHHGFMKWKSGLNTCWSAPGRLGQGVTGQQGYKKHREGRGGEHCWVEPLWSQWQWEDKR